MTSSRKQCTVNTVLDCRVESQPSFLTNFGKTSIFSVKVSTKRNSGVVDYFFVNYSSDLGIILNKGDFISLEGDIRTLNKDKSDFVSICYIYAKSIKILDKEPEFYKNDTVILNAKLHKFIKARESYDESGKIVANYQVKLSRGHSRNSYIEATSWGSDAVLLGNVHDSIDYISLECRLQSHISKSSNKLYMWLAVYHLDIENKEKESSADGKRSY